MPTSNVPASVGSVFCAMNPTMASQQRPPIQEFADPPIFGTVEISNDQAWKPSKVSSVPPSVTSGMGTEVSIQLALAYNCSEHAKQKGRWMLVTMQGTSLCISGIKGEDRPSDPAAWPACVTGGFRHDEAISHRDASNDERKKFAIVPKTWTVALRPTALREGGAK